LTQKAAFFDIAGTIIASNPWNYLFVHPQISQERVRRIRRHILPVYLGTKIGLVNDTVFRNHWIHLMAIIFEDWSQDQVQDVLGWVANEQMSNEAHEDVVARVAEHKQNGEHVVLVSGMFWELADAFAKRVGADAAIGTRLAYQDGICTGKITGEGCIGPRKLMYIHDYLEANGFPPALSEHYGYADSFSDVPLLTAVGHPTATYPDSKLMAIAQERHWGILPVQSS
jgi:HAD superfamily hydrolase (TIGR01490 family)